MRRRVPTIRLVVGLAVAATRAGLGRDLRATDRDLRPDGAVGIEGPAVLKDQMNEARWRP